MSHIGSKQNSLLNGEYGLHVKGKMKKLTSKIRRQSGKKETNFPPMPPDIPYAVFKVKKNKNGFF
jgi:hypothetical protein